MPVDLERHVVPCGRVSASLGVTVDGDSSTYDGGWSIPRRDGEHMGWVRGTTCRDVDTLDVLSGPHGVETSD